MDRYVLGAESTDGHNMKVPAPEDSVRRRENVSVAEILEVAPGGTVF
jgi:hypothetical protein